MIKILNKFSNKNNYINIDVDTKFKDVYSGVMKIIYFVQTLFRAKCGHVSVLKYDKKYACVSIYPL
jgi:hypothetical protein